MIYRILLLLSLCLHSSHSFVAPKLAVVVGGSYVTTKAPARKPKTGPLAAVASTPLSFAVQTCHVVFAAHPFTTTLLTGGILALMVDRWTQQQQQQAVDASYKVARYGFKRAHHFSLWKRNVMYWLPLQLVLFRYLPEHFQVPAMCIASLCSAIILSMITTTTREETHLQKGQPTTTTKAAARTIVTPYRTFLPKKRAFFATPWRASILKQQAAALSSLQTITTTTTTTPSEFLQRQMR